MDIKDLEPGTSWACRFRTVTFVDSEGTPLDTPDLKLGEAHPGTAGTYTGLGVIIVRDQEKQLVKLRDTVSGKEFVVNWQDCWDVDTIEWITTEDPRPNE